MRTDLSALAAVVLAACVSVDPGTKSDTGATDDTDFTAPPGMTTTPQPTVPPDHTGHTGCDSYVLHSAGYYCGRPLDLDGARRAAPARASTAATRARVRS